ncbi:MAG: hypothetical protein IJT54_03325 [Candidatus Methanomethylophilaceae archaeon]|nr:hypothetical protein [Candidatus Methanomethylophilaceae archaeon]
MSFPREIVIKRIRNELRDCSQYLGNDISIEDDLELPLELDMRISNVLAYESPDKVISEHGFKIIITEDYGQRKPEVRWTSHIFHPNIMDPDDGGFVCIKMLNEWDYGTRLVTFLSGIVTLLSHPNPMNPFGTDSCMAAARFFNDDNKAKFDVVVNGGGHEDSFRR